MCVITNNNNINSISSFNEVAKLFGQFFGLLFAIIGFASMNTSNEKSLLMMALLFMVALFYFVLVLVTMLQFHIKSFLPFMIVILLVGTVVSFLALIIILPTVAWILLGFLILILAFMYFKNRKELYPMIPQMIKNFIEGQSVNGNGISIHTSEILGVESLPV
jgi:membrane-associated HD superfamily phosphohydrolase